MLLKILRKPNLCYFAQQVAPNRKQTSNASAFVKYSVLKTAFESVPYRKNLLLSPASFIMCRRNLLRDTNAKYHLLRLRQQKKLSLLAYLLGFPARTPPFTCSRGRKTDFES
ncbi:hypothetical protein CDAR_290471 [Caerostris darwini]|uniref:Ribosomal protein S14 n=1 Tax=Caerostris darwini TaxID=1538125 RepID=A0AAV4N5L5_9ARAC|nr:hypothetical protein CDAR_290471 [Caerostris darwini]